MKRSVLLLLALALSLCLTACGGPAAQPSAEQTASQSVASQEAVQSAPQQDTSAEDAASASEQPSAAGILSQFSAQDLEGNSFDQTMLRDHTLTMVNVWATFCTPCINEMPDLGTLAQEYQDQGVQIVGLVSDVLTMDGSLDQDQMELAREIVASTSADYTHLVPSEDLYFLLGQISSVPTTFFVDENGAQVGGTYVGSKDKEQWQEIIDQLLTEVEA